jgi:energy-converting hydrogenase Eha subunit G
VQGFFTKDFLKLALPVYKNDVYGSEFGASAIATDSMVRHLFSAASPLFTPRAINRLGIGWTMSLFGFIALALMPIPWILFKWGPGLRVRSRYVKIAAEAT